MYSPLREAYSYSRSDWFSQVHLGDLILKKKIMHLQIYSHHSPITMLWYRRCKIVSSTSTISHSGGFEYDTMDLHSFAKYFYYKFYQFKSNPTKVSRGENPTYPIQPKFQGGKNPTYLPSKNHPKVGWNCGVDRLKAHLTLGKANKHRKEKKP